MGLLYLFTHIDGSYKTQVNCHMNEMFSFTAPKTGHDKNLAEAMKQL
jgi:hypothetical protein